MEMWKTWWNLMPINQYLGEQTVLFNFGRKLRTPDDKCRSSVFSCNKWLLGLRQNWFHPTDPKSLMSSIRKFVHGKKRAWTFTVYIFLLLSTFALCGKLICTPIGSEVYLLCGSPVTAVMIAFAYFSVSDFSKIKF